MGVVPHAPILLHALHILRRRRVRRLIVAGGMGLVTAACGIAMVGAGLARTPPSWWRAMAREDPATVQLARRVENAIETEVYQNRPAVHEGAVWRSDPWSVRVSAEEASAWLCVRLPAWVANQKDHLRWPRDLQEVQVAFNAGAMTVGARVPAGREGRVLTATVSPRLDERGRLFLPAQQMNVGRLAVPASWVLDHARGGGAAAQAIPENLRALPETEALVRAFEGSEALVESPVIKLGDGRSVRVLGFSLAGGVLEITCRTERPG